jgi:hypothetical protein
VTGLALAVRRGAGVGRSGRRVGLVWAAARVRVAGGAGRGLLGPLGLQQAWTGCPAAHAPHECCTEHVEKVAPPPAKQLHVHNQLRWHPTSDLQLCNQAQAPGRCRHAPPRPLVSPRTCSSASASATALSLPGPPLPGPQQPQAAMAPPTPHPAPATGGEAPGSRWSSSASTSASHLCRHSLAAGPCCRLMLAALLPTGPPPPPTGPPPAPPLLPLPLPPPTAAASSMGCSGAERSAAARRPPAGPAPRWPLAAAAAACCCRWCSRASTTAAGGSCSC